MGPKTRAIGAKDSCRFEPDCYQWANLLRRLGSWPPWQGNLLIAVKPRLSVGRNGVPAVVSYGPCDCRQIPKSCWQPVEGYARVKRASGTCNGCWQPDTGCRHPRNVAR
ncbi:MAG: hypothetical protein K6U80_01975 [Firmicutes bacterium]|nr:hypothetical protein [Bacillota bacterium]